MRHARYQLADGTWAHVAASAYAPQEHGTNLLCGDLACDASMNFRRGAIAEGGSVDREPCFSSTSRKEHRAECKALQHEDREERNNISLLSAIEEGIDVILHINFESKLGLEDSKGRLISQFRKAVRKQDPRYQFDKMKQDAQRKKNRSYITLPIHTADEMDRIIKKLKNKNYSSHTKVSFGGLVLSLEDFVLDTEDKIKKLYFGLISGHKSLLTYQDKKNVRHILFPRFVRLAPTKKSRLDDGEFNNIWSSIAKYSRKGFQEKLIEKGIEHIPFDGVYAEYRDVVLMNHFIFKKAVHPNDLRDIKRTCEAYVLAVPSMTQTDIQNACDLNYFQNGPFSQKKGTKFSSLSWRVSSSDQVVITDSTLSPIVREHEQRLASQHRAAQERAKQLNLHLS